MIDYGFGLGLDRLSDQIRDSVILFKWRNDPRIYEWTRQNEPLSWEEHAAWLKSLSTQSTIRMYKIMKSPNLYDDGSFIGVCGLTSLDLVNRRAEFSLYIAPEFQKKGYGSKALQTLLSHGFLTHGLNSIWGESFEGNPAVKMFEKLGFKKEGVRRDYYYRRGRFINAHLFSLLRSDWSSSYAHDFEGEGKFSGTLPARTEERNDQEIQERGKA